MFVTDKIIANVADEMQSTFEGGTLHSRSKIGEIARHAKEALADNGLPTRQSLCFVVAKVALMTWQETVHGTKAQLA
tara:strand:+ start:409 stop:639 length:231 start_codon:yes stop_codon:yes gene_type:complete